MNKTQSNYFNMMKAVNDVFMSNGAVWEQQGLLVTCRKRLHELIEGVGEAAAKQKGNETEGHTAAKEAARTVLEDRLFVVGRRLGAFANIEGDMVIAAQANFSRSSLDHLSGNNLLSLARSIFKVCDERFSLLKGYEIDEGVMKDLRSGIDEFADLNAHRDAVMDFRMENTASIASLLSKARQELKTMDMLVEGFIFDEAFLAVYFNARRIHDVRGGGKRKEE